MKLEKHLKRMQKKIGKIGLDKFRFYLRADSEYDGDIEYDPNEYRYGIWKSTDGLLIKSNEEAFISIQDFVAKLFDYSYQGYSIDTDKGCFYVGKAHLETAGGMPFSTVPPEWNSFEYEVTIYLTKNKDLSSNITVDVIEAFSKLVQ